MKRKNIENTEIDLNENEEATLTRITINTKKNGEDVASKKENRVLVWCLVLINILLVCYIIYQIVSIFVDGYAALS